MELDPFDKRHADLWQAFVDLKQSAGIGFAPEPVPPESVAAWCNIHSIPKWRWQTFWRTVHALDMEATRILDSRGKKRDNAQAGD
jgi:hypothetical protein